MKVERFKNTIRFQRVRATRSSETKRDEIHKYIFTRIEKTQS
jgi:hypothetical protein